jgi:hypothetical protein
MSNNRFVTINTSTWNNSPYVPKSNGRIISEQCSDNVSSEYWYVDSRGGKWSTLFYSGETIHIGETIQFAFWVHIKKNFGTTFRAQLFQSDWDKATTFELSNNCPYLIRNIGKYYLFSIPYIPSEDHIVNYTLSMNDFEATIFSAEENDIIKVVVVPTEKGKISVDKYSEITEEDYDIWDCSPYQIVKCYKEDFPNTRFIGLKYSDEDRVNGMYGWHWGQWFETGKFEIIEKLSSIEFQKIYPDADAYIGLERYKEGEPYEYWIGMFLPENSVVPDSYSYVDFNFNSVGTCWIKGHQENVYGHERDCYEELIEKGMQVLKDSNGACWFFERYGCPRFTTPDKDGEIILDIGYFVK